MRRHFTACSFAAFILVVLLAAAASAVDHRFTESFNTKQYCDKVNTTALWDTIAGQLKLPPFAMSLTGTYNTDGNARGGIVIQSNYAFVCDYLFGLQVFNVTNPASPTIAGNYNTPGSAVGLYIDGNFAYVADAASGIIVLSITNPASPTLLGSYDTPGSAQDVVVDGNYAYVADYASGLIVLNTTNPGSPTLAGSYDTPGNARGVAIAGNCAYVADGTSGLQIINITNPASPTLLGTYDTPGTAYDVAIAGDRAYVADYNGDLQVINITNPASPTLVASLSTSGNAYGIDVNGDYAYIAAYGAGLLMIDISNPAVPVLMGSFATAGLAYDVVVDGNQAFVADDLYGLEIIRISLPLEPASAVDFGTFHPNEGITIDGDYAYVGLGTWGMRVFDISDLGNPDLLRVVSVYAYDVAIAGDYAYIAGGSSGFSVYNISDPANPTLAGSYDTPGSAQGVAISGDYAFVADGTSGLEILNITNPASPTLVASYNTPYSAYSVAIAGDYAYVSDGPTGLLVLSIVSPSSPTLVGTCDTPDFANNVTIVGDYAFVADGANVQLVNIMNAASPYVASSFNTPGRVGDVAVAGDYAYVAYNNGICAVNISNLGGMTSPWSWSLTDEVRGVAVHGDYVLAAGYEGLIVLRGAQRTLDDTKNKGRSLAVASTPQEIEKVKIATAQADSIKWELSGNGGTSWMPVPTGGPWFAFSSTGSSLLWRSTHVLTGYPINPACSQLTIDWLYASATIDSIRDIAGDQGGKVRVYFARSAYDFSAEVVPIATYNVWRRVDNAAMLEEVAAAKGADAVAFAASAAGGKFGDLPVFNMGDRLFMASNPTLEAAGMPPGLWEVMGSFSATQLDQYIYPTLTLADSTVEDGMAYAVYMVTAHTATPSVWYASPPDSGYSLDNLAPHVPTSFAVAYNSGGGNNLSWDTCPDHDFEYFKVYRGTSEDFEPGPGNLVQKTTDAGWLDTVEDGYLYCYKISAVDHAGNESAPASAGTVTGTDTPAAPKSFALHQNVPNPFNPMTRIRFDLPEAADVRLVVYNVNGQMIRVLADAPMPAGAREVTWDGRDSAGRAAASGIYFYRLDAGRFTQTRKMILLR